MKCSRLAALALILSGARASASTELIVTAGGGVGREGGALGCLDETGTGSCPSTRPWGALLLGAGIERVSEGGVRGSLRLEGNLGFGQLHNRDVHLVGVAGWQGERLILEGGLGSALLWNAEHDPALGGLFHLGLGVRILPALSALVRLDAIISDDRRPYFFGLALEYRPLFRAGP